ncbi:portal protein [Azospirillum sp. A39]|uniref:portal protein n=1 Tax=Azospirillum sp. A39 TaxID=3462279 RepID=UPI00404563AF
MVDRPEPMDDDDFQAIVAAAITDAVSYQEEDIAPERAKALEYFLGKPFGDEQDGRSDAVMREVRDTVEAILPSLARVFYSTSKLVEFVPHGPEDEAMAEQATDYVNWIFFDRNPGWRNLITWAKDGLLSKVGVVKYAWERKRCVTTNRYSGLGEEEALVLLSEPDVEVVSQDAAPDGTLSLEIRTVRWDEGVTIRPVPPEEFLIDEDARSDTEFSLIGQRREVTISDLVAMGYDWDEVSELGSDDSLDTSEERLARQDDVTVGNDASVLDPAQRRVMYSEIFMFVDRDGDGIAELRRVCVGGSANKVLHDEPVDDHPFASWTPFLTPHKFFGESVADVTMDLQRIKSIVVRQTLDNLVLANDPGLAVDDNQLVDVNEVLSTDLGRIIRTKGPPAGVIAPVAVPFVAGQSLPVLGYLDEVKEGRTGVSKATLGLDADALQSTTRAGVAATISGSQAKIEMLARNFAEDGLVRLFRGILRLIVQRQDRAKTIRLRGQWVPMDPRGWAADMDVTVNVGLGRGTEEQRMQGLGMILQAQREILGRFGLNNPLVTLGQLRDTLAEICAIYGFKDADRFFQRVDPNMQPPPPPPDAATVKAQADAQAEMAKLQLQAQKQQAELRLKERQLEAEMQLRREQMVAEFQLKREEMMMRLGGGSNLGAPVQMGGQAG